MKRLTVIGLILVAVVVLLAGSIDGARRKFKAKLTGAEHRPAVVTDTTGRFRIRFNKDATAAKFRLKVKNGADITEAHLHCIVGTDGPIVAFLFGPLPDGVDVHGKLARSVLRDEDIVTLDPVCGIANLRDLRTAMENGRVYVNVHSLAGRTSGK